MKFLIVKILFLILIIFSFWKNSISQSGWYQQNSGTSNVLTGIYFLDNNTGFVCGYSGTILKTSDSGLNWQLLNAGLNINYIFSIYFSNPNTGFIIAEVGYRKVVKTTNGGISWDTTGNPIANMMYFLNSSTGWSGWRNIYKTIDTGNTWTYMSTFPSSTIVYDIYFVNEFTGYACGNFAQPINPETSLIGGRIFKTTNSGLNWNTVFYGNLILGGNSINKICFVNENTGYALGSNGSPGQPYLFKTINAANNWTLTSIPSGMSFLQFVDEQTGWIGGDQGTNLYTSNGGLNWSQQLSNINDRLLEIYMLNNYTGWVVANTGVILKTTTGGITGINTISSEIPNEFKLYQNYPNPFNPTTNIEFSLPEKTFAMLKVFDISGKEVAELVNENLSAGTFRYEFNARLAERGDNLPSGVYYYKLETNEFSQTKKMLLIK